MTAIDLNCDMGESYGTYILGYDEQTLPHVTSINVACGFHASDPDNMAKTVKNAKKYGIAVGAHPGYPDLVGFGRRTMALSPEEVKNAVIYQIGALDAFCKSEGVKMQHVKAHGALYNTAGDNLAVAEAIAEAIKAVNPELYMLCLANSQMTTAAKNAGLRYVEEAFADRAYTEQGTLVSRKLEGSVLHDINAVVARVLMMVNEHKVISIDGKSVPLAARTICVHGDTPGAVDMVKAIRTALDREGIVLRAFGG
jgi:5-oxoprolinase (ATP-hydrolysing) subunit A